MTTQRTTFSNREALWSTLQQGEQSWDLVIVGGGIIGAGILREAARRGLRALLLEQRDFAWGTSSRSSKMVHGGLRYIAQGDIKLTRESLQERERLLKELPGLIDRMGYYFTLRKGQFPGRIPFSILLTIYDTLAGIKDHRYFNKKAVEQHFSGISGEGLRGACYYTDTVTDDARLVLRILQEAIDAGGVAANYMKVERLLRRTGQADGVVDGVVVANVETGERVEVRARAVINATGAWADRLRNEVNPEVRVRPLRGSHLVIPRERLPVDDVLTILHPRDKRPVFIFPWEGATVVGNTDLDHDEDLDTEARMSAGELDYLLSAVGSQFPGHAITRDDIISSWSGVRPVIGSDKAKDPSRERRNHAVWVDQGLVTVSGGKLTTFRLIALDAVNAATGTLGTLSVTEASDAVFAAPDISPQSLDTDDRAWALRLIGRYGNHAQELLNTPVDAERDKIAGTEFCLAECRWAARNESVVHLDDLLLRRTRLGSLLWNGGESIFPQLELICREELQWDAQRWQAELARYQDIWKTYYYLPE
ncbi:MAG: glycerol-3-phosphate dehydrogenase/oxidase [Halieaceae bacterium]|jgi:glycerol-3-phosphate dehydrogenase|nr:glycerol-3-phosphate dehydrogenase/oxidase [Halieaceae bacterium]